MQLDKISFTAEGSAEVYFAFMFLEPKVWNFYQTLMVYVCRNWATLFCSGRLTVFHTNRFQSTRNKKHNLLYIKTYVDTFKFQTGRHTGTSFPFKSKFKILHGISFLYIKQSSGCVRIYHRKIPISSRISNHEITSLILILSTNLTNPKKINFHARIIEVKNTREFF